MYNSIVFKLKLKAEEKRDILKQYSEKLMEKVVPKFEEKLKGLEDMYQKEMSFEHIGQGKEISFCSINLTQKKVMSFYYKQENMLNDDRIDKVNYFDLVSPVFTNIYLSDKEKKEFSVETLIRKYKKNNKSITRSFLADDKDTDETIYLFLECHVTENPLTNDLVAFFYTLDTTENTIENQISFLVLDTGYECAGMLFAKKRMIKFLSNEALNQYNISDGASWEVLKNLAEQWAVWEQRDILLHEFSLQRILQVLETEEDYVYEFTLLTPKNELRRKRIQFTYSNKDEQTILFIVRDIQKEFLMEQENQKKLREAEEAVKQAVAEKNKFLEHLNHEIRTPVNVIIGALSLLKSELQYNSEVEKYLDSISLSSDYIMTIINNVLDMAKIEDPDFTLNRTPVRLDLFMNGVKAACETLCRQKNISLKVDYQPVADYALIDEKRLLLVIINLISNSLKSTPVGGEITIKYKGVPDLNVKMVTGSFEIIDNGKGMSQEFQENLFKPFFQEGSASKLDFHGTGIGLSIVKQLIDKMGGSIKVKSKLGKGTSITFEIKYEIVNKRPLKIENSKTELIKDKKILVVEDYEINTIIMCELLKRAGAETIVAIDGEESVQIFKKSKLGEIDAILMDIHMPVKNGFEASKEIRELLRPDAKIVPIIAVTSNSMEEDIDRMNYCGINFHLSKPVEPEVLFSTLKKALVQ